MSKENKIKKIGNNYEYTTINVQVYTEQEMTNILTDLNNRLVRLQATKTVCEQQIEELEQQIAMITGIVI